MNQKNTLFTILVLVTLIILVGLGITYFKYANSKSNPIESTSTSILFQKENIIYQLSHPDLSQKVFLKLTGTLGTYSVSPDHTNIAYINGYGEEYDNNIYVLNVKTNTTTKIASDTHTNRMLSWSKNGKYVMVDSGTGPQGMLTIYKVNTGKRLMSMGNSYFIWLDDETAIITTRETVQPPRPWGSGHGYSLSKINIISGNSEILIKADGTNDYELTKFENNCLYYSKKTVTNASDWVDQNKIGRTNYCLHLNTNKSTLVSTTEAATLDSRTENSIVAVYPQFKNKIYGFVQNPNDSNIVLFEVSGGESIYDADIYLIDLKNTKIPLKKIGKGTNISWF